MICLFVLLCCACLLKLVAGVRVNVCTLFIALFSLALWKIFEQIDGIWRFVCLLWYDVTGGEVEYNNFKFYLYTSSFISVRPREQEKKDKYHNG